MIIAIIALILTWVVTVWVLGSLIVQRDNKISLQEVYINALDSLVEDLVAQNRSLRNPKLSHFETLVKEHKERSKNFKRWETND